MKKYKKRILVSFFLQKSSDKLLRSDYTRLYYYYYYFESWDVALSLLCFFSWLLVSVRVRSERKKIIEIFSAFCKSKWLSSPPTHTISFTSGWNMLCYYDDEHWSQACTQPITHDPTQNIKNISQFIFTCNLIKEAISRRNDEHFYFSV